nr:MAG TPA_asm: hypothetical protein [Caudoviricetes sp.]
MKSSPNPIFEQASGAPKHLPFGYCQLCNSS